jgi:hypothetical protein
MCVIIVKKPDVIIPYDKIDSACAVNNDGWGLSVLQEPGKLLNYKGFKASGNDPDEIYDLINRHKEHTQFLHLRFVTKGDKNLENTHPFPLIEEEDYQLYLMHNGTLSFSKFDIPDGQSDTRAFCEQYASPTAKAFYTVAGKDLLNDVNFLRMMDHFISASWYFALYDNLGNYRVLGGQGHWHDSDTWWSSNTYSFNSSHRIAYSNNDYQNTHWHNWARGESFNREPFRDNKGKLIRWDAAKHKYVPVEEEEKKTTVTKATTTTTTEKEVGKSVIPFLSEKNIKSQGVALGYALSEAKRKGLDWASHTPPKERPTFTELCDLDNLDQACLLNEEDIEELIGNYPEATLILILDLLHALYFSKRVAQQKELAA